MYIICFFSCEHACVLSVLFCLLTVMLWEFDSDFSFVVQEVLPFFNILSGRREIARWSLAKVTGNLIRQLSGNCWICQGKIWSGKSVFCCHQICLFRLYIYSVKACTVQQFSWTELKYFNAFRFISVALHRLC